VKELVSTIMILMLLQGSLLAQQTVLKQDVIVNGNRYFITLEKYNGKSEVWARHQLLMSHFLDEKIMTIQTQTIQKEEAMNLICRNKRVFDTGKTIVGCTSIIGSGVCVVSGGGAGIGVPVCSAIVMHTASGGLVDCVSGLTSVISRHFGKTDFGYAVEQSAGAVSWTSLVSVAIDAACVDWKANK
jgi:hypothetical protein